MERDKTSWTYNKAVLSSVKVCRIHAAFSFSDPEQLFPLGSDPDTISSWVGSGYYLILGRIRILSCLGSDPDIIYSLVGSGNYIILGRIRILTHLGSDPDTI